MKAKYPLQQLVIIKKRRLEEAEKKLKLCKETLKKEKEKELQLVKERDKTYHHKEDKIKQLRENLDAGTATYKIQQIKAYIKVVEEELSEKEAKVKTQQKEVKKAEEEVEVARKNLIKKQHDLEKLHLHRKEWEKEERALMEHQAGIETDELGTAMHSLKKPKK